MPASFSFGSFARAARAPSCLRTTYIASRHAHSYHPSGTSCHDLAFVPSRPTCQSGRRNFSAAPSALTAQPEKDSINSMRNDTSELPKTSDNVHIQKCFVKQKLSEEVRAAMRHVAHPVAIITATDVSVSPKGAPHAWRGATVSSFNTVTLSPEPIVSFNIKRVSSTFDAIRSSGLFTAHFLSGQHRAGEMVATRFSRGNATSPFHDKHGKLESYVFRDPELQPRAREPPIIRPSGRGPPLAPLNLTCEYLPEKLVHIADHVVVFGRVIGVYDRMTERRFRHGHTPILSYVNRGYMRHDWGPMELRLRKPGSDEQKEEVSQRHSEG